MDDARFWIWEKQRGVNGGLPMRGSGHNLNNDAQATPQSSYDVSWEERAFAEDAAGHLGGCIWPPRSYSCNFCGREFRSAQALGGHMNVHRRDRARLKQSSLSPQDVLDHHQVPLQHGTLQSQKPFVDSHVASQVFDLAYNSNPNPNPNHVSFNMTAPTSLSLKISSPSLDQEPTFVQLGLREGKQPRSSNGTVADHCFQTTNLKMDSDKRSPQILRAEGGLMHCDKPDISVSLNLFFQTQATKRSKNESPRDDHDHQDDDCRGKRRKLTTDESSTMSSSYTKSSIVLESLDVQQKLKTDQRMSSSFIHELDLELRLGELPNVK